MPHAKPAAAITAAAMLLCGCGAVIEPPQGRGKIADPRTTGPNRLGCMIAHHLPAQKVGRTGIQIGALPGGPTVQFMPTEGAAQALQINGRVQGAEVIGSALVYPHQADDAELAQIENCVGEGVPG
jgi:hypothetical protein